MKQVLLKAAHHPHTKAAATVVMSEFATHGISGVYERFMDKLAYKIAVGIHTLEKEDNKKENNHGI